MKFKKILTAGCLLAMILSASSAPTLARKVTLRYWIWDNNQLPAVKSMIAKFNQVYPNIIVKTDVVSDYWTKLLTSLAGGVAPDVWWINMPTFSVWSRRGMLTNLQPYINADKEATASVKAMWKTLTSAYSYKGALYGIPRDYDTIAVLYNEDLVKAAGLTPPMNIEKTWTWDTLSEYARKLTIKQDGKTKQGGFYSTGSDQQCWLNFVYSNGGDVFKWNDNGSDEFTLNSPEAIKAIQWLADKKLKDGVSMDGGETQWTQGKMAMITQGDWPLINYTKTIKKFKWNIAELPFNPANNKRVSVIHGLADVINPASKYKKEAFTFIQFLASKDAQMVLGNTGTVIPSRLDVEHLFFSPKLYPSNRKAYERAADYSKPYPMSRKVIYQYAVTAIDTWMQKIWNGSMSVPMALEGCTRDMTAMIKRYSK